MSNPREIEFKFERMAYGTIVLITERGNPVIATDIGHESERLKELDPFGSAKSTRSTKYDEEFGDQLNFNDWMSVVDVLETLVLRRPLQNGRGHETFHDRKEAKSCEFCYYTNLFAKRWQEFQKELKILE